MFLSLSPFLLPSLKKFKNVKERDITRNGWREEVHRARCGEGAEHTALPECPHAHQPWCAARSAPWVAMEASLRGRH